MKVLIKIFLFLLSLNINAQLLFHQDTFRGGVTSDGVSYAAFEYFSADTINFQLYIPTSSTIRKAFLLSLKFPFIKGTLPQKDAPLPVKFNNAPITLDSSDIVTNTFLCYYTPAAVNWILAKDVTSLVQYTGNKLITPNQSVLMNLDTSRHYVYAGYLLIILYDEPSFPATNVSIFLNNKNFTSVMTHNIAGLNPVDNNKDVGLSIWAENVTSNPSGYTLSYTINSSLGNNFLGTLDQYKGSTPQSKSLPGSFYYENNTLSGLVDDTPDAFIDSTDALANIKTYIANNATTFTITSFGSSPVDCIDYRLGYILTYSSPCPPLQGNITQIYPACVGGSVQLSGTQINGSTYSWYPGYGLNDSAIFNPISTPTVSTNYILTVTDSNGCHHTEHHKVNIYPLPKTTGVSISPAICGDIRGTATVTPAYDGTTPYLYNIGAGIQSSTVFSNLNPGTYSLTVSDSMGCAYQTTFTLNEINTADANFVMQPDTLCVGQNPYIANTGGTVNNYSWYVNNILVSNAQSLNYSFDTGVYVITLIAYHNLSQCSDTVSHTLLVKECPPDSFNISAPNIFTPNADGINDIWLPLVYERGFNISDLELAIYDRWGILVFESTDKNKGWDGRTTSGLICSEGTYFYVLRYEANSGAEKKEGSLKGFLQLSR